MPNEYYYIWTNSSKSCNRQSAGDIVELQAEAVMKNQLEVLLEKKEQSSFEKAVKTTWHHLL